MTYPEILEALKEAGLPWALEQLEAAVREEAVELIATREKTPEENLEAAQAFYAEDITNWYESEAELTPQGVLGHRTRYVNSWAIAQLLLIGELDEDEWEEVLEEEDDDEDEKQKLFMRLCLTNATMANKIVELTEKLYGRDGK